MSLSITLAKRAPGHAENIREAGSIPGVIYGAGGQSVAVAVASRAFAVLYRDAGTSTLVDMTIEGGQVEKGLIQDVQYDPVTGQAIHIDFRRIDMNKAMTTTIPIRFIGEAPAVKGLGGTLVEALHNLEITCLPKDLVSAIEVDISVLTGFDKTVHVSDLQLAAGITSVVHPDTVVVKVAAPLTEDELKAMEAPVAVDLSKIEVEKKGKDEEAAAAAAAEKAEKAA